VTEVINALGLAKAANTIIGARLLGFKNMCVYRPIDPAWLISQPNENRKRNPSPTSTNPQNNPKTKTLTKQATNASVGSRAGSASACRSAWS
jgi:hypothetical protein